MKTLALINLSAVRVIERVTLILGTVSLIAALFFVGRGAFSLVEQKRTVSELSETNRQIQMLTETVAKSKKLRFKPVNVKELSLVQAALDHYASENDCQLLELTSNNDEAAYLSRYQKKTDVTGWKQTALQCQAVGTIGNILSYISKVTSLSVPVELTSLEVVPMDKVQNGRPVVTAKFSVLVIRSEAKA